MCYATNGLGSAQETVDMNHQDLQVAEGKEFEITGNSNEDNEESQEIMERLEENSQALENFKQEMGIEIRALKNPCSCKKTQLNTRIAKSHPLAISPLPSAIEMTNTGQRIVLR